MCFDIPPVRLLGTSAANAMRMIQLLSYLQTIALFDHAHNTRGDTANEHA